MLYQIKHFLKQHLVLSEQETSEEDRLQLASVALLLEIMDANNQDHTKERKLILSLVQKSYSLTAEQSEALIARSEKRRQEATDYFQFTSLINKNCTLEQKIELIESLWRVTWADCKIDPLEEYLVRKFAELLYVPHIAFIKAKNRISQ